MPIDDIEKKYYKISQVAELLDIPMSTLRYWESQFKILSPKRSTRGTRQYSVSDIEKIRLVNYLVKERGIKIDVAQEMIKHNHKGISKRYQAVERLREIRAGLLNLLTSIDSFRK